MCLETISNTATSKGGKIMPKTRIIISIMLVHRNNNEEEEEVWLRKEAASKSWITYKRWSWGIGIRPRNHSNLTKIDKWYRVITYTMSCWQILLRMLRQIWISKALLPQNRSIRLRQKRPKIFSQPLPDAKQPSLTAAKQRLIWIEWITRRWRNSLPISRLREKEKGKEEGSVRSNSRFSSASKQPTHQIRWGHLWIRVRQNIITKITATGRWS